MSYIDIISYHFAVQNLVFVKIGMFFVKFGILFVKNIIFSQNNKKKGL